MENRMNTRVAMCETRRYATPMGSTVGWIVSEPEILDGKPCVKGTRLSVEFLLELAASGATPAQILASYPQLTDEGLAAAFSYAAQALKREHTSGAADHGSSRSGAHAWMGESEAIRAECRRRLRPRR